MAAPHFISRGLQVAARIARPLALASTATLAIAIAGCAQQPVRIEDSSLSHERDLTAALALPPPGGPAVVSVIERIFANAIQQDIVLATSSTVPGQNTLRVQFFGPMGSSRGDTTLTDYPPTEGSIGREMRRALPGIPMVRSPLFAQNAYGPFGYATGRSSSGDLCVYAWQRLAGMRSDATVATRGSIQVRLRLCQTGATEEGLLAVMYGYTIKSAIAGETWNPYGTAPAADPRFGTTGQPIHPKGITGAAQITVAAPVEDRTPRPTPRPAVASAPAQQTAPMLPTVPANAPIVPPPPGTATPQAVPQVPPPPGPGN